MHLFFFIFQFPSVLLLHLFLPFHVVLLLPLSFPSVCLRIYLSGCLYIYLYLHLSLCPSFSVHNRVTLHLTDPLTASSSLPHHYLDRAVHCPAPISFHFSFPHTLAPSSRVPLLSDVSLGQPSYAFTVPSIIYSLSPYH